MFDKLNKIRREVSRPLLMLVISVVLFRLSTWLPKDMGEEAFAPFLMGTGFVFGIAALSHVTRRTLFPGLDLHSIAKKAIDDKNPAAGQVFLAICIVLSSLIIANVLVIH